MRLRDVRLSQEKMKPAVGMPISLATRSGNSPAMP